MTENNEHLKNLSEIRNMMERSSRFISLSGLSGVFAGLLALMGAAAVYIYFNEYYSPRYYNMGVFSKSELIRNRDFLTFLVFLFCDGALVLTLSLISAMFFTTRNARKKGLKVWDATAKRMLLNLFIPLIAGGFFCLALVYHGKVYLIAPATLIFYGLALINTSKYTLNDVRYLGLCEIALGVVASFFVGYGLIAWAIGFGVLHIIYGSIMYFKYEK